MNKNGILIVVIILLLGCTVYFGYDKFFNNTKQPCSSSNQTTNVNSNDVSNEKIFDQFVGKYVSSEYDESKLDELDNYQILEIKSDGTAYYKKVFKQGNSEYAEGKIAISNDKIYLFNDKCDAYEVVDRECQYANCEKVKEFDYDSNGTIKINGINELSKQ